MSAISRAIGNPSGILLAILAVLSHDDTTHNKNSILQLTQDKK
ncbi:hypothetical protein D6_00245 [Faustovirus]|nr:hypothetical protein D6_00245 [Faustovirus]AMP44218.1 hypothetical protein PRJ_Dakar_00262 [Faustovirus]